MSPITRERIEWRVTLAARHASPATVDAYLANYRIGRGPKRTVRQVESSATKDERLLVPPIDSWTLDTVRALLWELPLFLPGFSGLADVADADQDAVIERWVRDHAVMAIVDTRWDRELHLAVELLKCGVRIIVSLGGMSMPMRAALASLPTAPFPLAAIAHPSTQPYGEDELRDEETGTDGDDEEDEETEREFRASLLKRVDQTLKRLDDMIDRKGGSAA